MDRYSEGKSKGRYYIYAQSEASRRENWGIAGDCRYSCGGGCQSRFVWMS